jgi:hypothetical protein
VGAVHVFHERKPAWASCLSIYRQHNLRGWRNTAEVRAQLSFGRTVGKIADEQPNSQSALLVNEKDSQGD